jgi:predicted methyltransferase
MQRSKIAAGLTMLIGTIMFSACSQRGDEAMSAAAANGSAVNSAPTIYELAVASSARPDGDRARDASRKPAEVLEFLAIKPGMTVLDMFTGSGYYAEIIASVVGSEGRVIAQSNQAYLGFVGDAFEQRFGSDRLTNIKVLMAENNELALAADSLDVIMLVLSFHDLYLADPDNGWARIDVPRFLAELKKGLKPGGTVGIIDHYAETGASSESGNTVHRIDPAIVIAAMQAADFELVARSDLLRNPDDDLSKIVFDPEVRGKTDRFLLRFRSRK